MVEQTATLVGHAEEYEIVPDVETAVRLTGKSAKFIRALCASGEWKAVQDGPGKPWKDIRVPKDRIQPITAEVVREEVAEHGPSALMWEIIRRNDREREEMRVDLDRREERIRTLEEQLSTQGQMILSLHNQLLRALPPPAAEEPAPRRDAPVQQAYREPVKPTPPPAAPVAEAVAAPVRESAPVRDAAPSVVEADDAEFFDDDDFVDDVEEIESDTYGHTGYQPRQRARRGPNWLGILIVLIALVLLGYLVFTLVGNHGGGAGTMPNGW